MRYLTSKANTFFSVLVISLAIVGLSTTDAAAEQAILLPVNGVLTDADERPIDDTVEVTFSLYGDAASESPFWSETQELTVRAGSFSAYLGSLNTLNASAFADHRAPYISIQIDDDREMDRWPVAHVPFAAVSDRADDANTLQGMSPDELGVDGDPEAVNASQVDYDDNASQLGATNSQQALDALASRLDELEDELAAAHSERDALASQVTAVEDSQSTLQSRVNDAESDITDHEERLSTVENDLSTLQDQDARITSVEQDLDDVQELAGGFDGRITDVEQDLDDVEEMAGGFDGRIADVEYTTEPMSRMTINGQDAVTFEDVNLHLRSGTGATTDPPNGRGNLIIGYDEGDSADKTGSHNLVMGNDNAYHSYAGIVGGSNNTIEANYSSVISGTSNTASGNRSVVVAGSNNSSSATNSAIVSGYGNETSGSTSAILSGWANTTNGSWSAVVAGTENETEGMDSVVVGGSNNTAADAQSVVVQ